MASMFRQKTEQPSFLRLARKADVDNETAYTICRLIDAVGWEIKENWDSNWLDGKRGRYRSLIATSIVEPAWRILTQRKWLSLQTGDTRRISTIVPLEGMTNLRSLVLQNNRIADIQPLSGMSGLKCLNIYANKVSDLSPLRCLQSLEELSLGKNPIESLAVLEQLPNLRRLSLTADQVPGLKRCKCLRAVQILEIEGDGSVKSLVDFPEMPSLTVLKVLGVKDTAGIEQFDSLNTLKLSQGDFARLNGVEKLKGLTHLEVSTSRPLSLEALNKLYALRLVEIGGPEVRDLSALARLPVLHEFDIGDETQCDRIELARLRKSLTPWEEEFKAPREKASPSLDIEIVSQETFDYYDGKASFGIKSGECEDGMFQSERDWLAGELQSTLEVSFKEDEDMEDDGDFLLPGTAGFRRSERLVIHSLRAYESVGEIITAVQQVLCDTRNDWIVYFQSLLSERPDFEELPEGVQDFIVWIYPDKIMATKDNAAIVRELIN